MILFLLLYYRLLGLIAAAGLIAYALYFYALIKLIPITLTLPGIAGLILTIGVAADANIVIFERVKEEIRAGRSIRSGIATGYKKGLTAIIDANVVTIMTAFILFVLATAQVQGFALTLGIGVIVSLFTAVLATQAILMTRGDTKMISRPSLLGVREKAHRWKFDFMGKSRYFFSMSGVILLIGALAVGGRGLNLGIDFTSGTRDHRAPDPARDDGECLEGRAEMRRRGESRGPEGRHQGRHLPDLLQATCRRAAWPRSRPSCATATGSTPRSTSPRSARPSGARSPTRP